MAVKFKQMTSESEALFYDNSESLISVANTPSTLFRGGEWVMLAVRVTGMDNGLSKGEYIGKAYCNQEGCSAYF